MLAGMRPKDSNLQTLAFKIQEIFFKTTSKHFHSIAKSGLSMSMLCFL